MNQQNTKTLRMDDSILTEGNYGHKMKVDSNNSYIIGKYSSQVSVLVANNNSIALSSTTLQVIAT